MENWVAMYSAAMSPPRCPVPRPSSRSWDRNRTWARIRSGLIVSIAANAAEEGRGAATGAWTGLAEFWAKATRARLKKDKRRLLRIVRMKLLDERRRNLRMVLL